MEEDVQAGHGREESRNYDVDLDMSPPRWCVSCAFELFDNYLKYLLGTLYFVYVELFCPRSSARPLTPRDYRVLLALNLVEILTHRTAVSGCESGSITV